MVLRVTTPQAPAPSPTRSGPDKVRLFLSLFRGRDDVYPTRWENREGPLFQAKSTRIALLEPKPALVRATLSNRLFIDQAGVPGRLLAQLKPLAAFQNPEFHKRRMQRLSTHGIPRIISCGEVLSGHLALPRALVREVTTCLSEHGVGSSWKIVVNTGGPSPVEFQGE